MSVDIAGMGTVEELEPVAENSVHIELGRFFYSYLDQQSWH